MKPHDRREMEPLGWLSTALDAAADHIRTTVRRAGSDLPTETRVIAESTVALYDRLVAQARLLEDEVRLLRNKLRGAGALRPGRN